MSTVACMVYALLCLQYHRSVCVAGAGGRPVRAGLLQRQFVHDHVHGAAVRGPRHAALPQPVHGSWARGILLGGTALLQTPLPVPLAGSHDTIHQTQGAHQDKTRLAAVLFVCARDLCKLQLYIAIIVRPRGFSKLWTKPIMIWLFLLLW